MNVFSTVFIAMFLSVASNSFSQQILTLNDAPFCHKLTFDAETNEWLDVEGFNNNPSTVSRSKIENGKLTKVGTMSFPESYFIERIQGSTFFVGVGSEANNLWFGKLENGRIDKPAFQNIPHANFILLAHRNEIWCPLSVPDRLFQVIPYSIEKASFGAETIVKPTDVDMRRDGFYIGGAGSCASHRDILYLVAPSRRPTFFDVSNVNEVELAVEFGGTELELPVDKMVHGHQDGHATCDISPSRSKAAVVSFYRDVLNVDIWNLNSKKLLVSDSWKLKTPGMWMSLVDFVDDSFFVVIAGNNFYCFGISNNKLENVLTINGDQKNPKQSHMCGVGIRRKHNDYWYANYDSNTDQLAITLVPFEKVRQTIRVAK